MWWTSNSRDPDFKRRGALPAHRELLGCYVRSPRVQASIDNIPIWPMTFPGGFGHQDWHWNCVTLREWDNTIDPWPATAVNGRRRGSQMALCETVSAIPWITAGTSYAWTTKPQ